MSRTTSSTTADGAVRRILQVAADVADLTVQKALAAKVLAVQVLGAPEAARGDGAALRRVGDGGGGVGRHGEARGVREGADEAGEEGRQRHGLRRGVEEQEDGDEEDG